MQITKENLFYNMEGSEIAFTNKVGRGAQRVILCTKLAAVALRALAYHGGALLIKALPATINLLIGKLPASLSWKNVFNDHAIPLKFAIKTIVMAPVVAWTSSHLDHSYQMQRLGLFPATRVKRVEKSLEVHISVPSEELAIVSDEGPQENLETTKTVFGYIKQHPIKSLALCSLGFGVATVIAVPVIWSYFATTDCFNQYDQISLSMNISDRDAWVENCIDNKIYALRH